MAQGGPYFACLTCRRLFPARSQDRHMGHRFMDARPGWLRRLLLTVMGR